MKKILISLGLILISVLSFGGEAQKSGYWENDKRHTLGHYVVVVPYTCPNLFEYRPKKIYIINSKPQWMSWDDYYRCRGFRK